MWCKLLMLLVVVAGVVPSSRAAIHCQPGDEGCAQCQAACDAIPLSALPECCEAHSACCPTYSQACGHCKANAAIDSHFPEYCCASFTDCCDMVPGLNIVAGFNIKQGSKIPSKEGPAKAMQKQPRSDSPDEPHPEPEAEPAPAADEASASDVVNVSEAAPPTPRTRAESSSSPLPTTQEVETRSFKPVVIRRPTEGETQDLEGEARSAVAAVSRGRGRTRADVNLSSGTVSDTASVSVPASGRASSSASRAPSASPGRLTLPRGDRTSAAPVSPASGSDDLDSSQSSSSQTTRSRQATVLSRRSQPSAADRKVMAAASLDRRGRITSRGRVV